MAPTPRRPGPRARRAPAPPLEPLRPATELRPLLGAEILVVPPWGPEEPSHRFRILRPLDLVVLEVACFGMVLEPGGGGSAELVTGDEAGRLEVRFTFQHALEAAEPEVQNPPPPAPVPIPARAARPSRLVFAVPAGARIPYSSSGVLTAMSQLELRVAPLALPRPVPRVRPLLTTPVIDAVTLPGGLRLAREASGLVLLPPARRTQAPVAERSATGLIATATALRSARAMLATERAVNLSGVELDRAGADGLRPGIADLVVVPPVFRPVRPKPRPPRADETAIEAPFRLILSPSTLEGFAHAIEPRILPPAGRDDPVRVELWHSRLGVRRVDGEGNVSIDEASDPQKAVRAIWTRDADTPAPGVIPFLASLNQKDREDLVRQSADPTITTPQPVAVEKLYLSALGAWLELHGRWDATPYAQQGILPITAWDHEATSGRDQYVRVERPYYLFPFGHRCALITITERKMKDVVGPQARLYQRRFLSIQEPVRTYAGRDMPFIQVRLRPLVTPNLDIQAAPPFDMGGAVPPFGSDLFWPTVGGARYRFVLDCLDHDGRRVVVQAALLAVGANLGNPAEAAAIVGAYEGAPERPIDGDGQSVAMARSTKPGDTAYETRQLRFTGAPGARGSQTSTPRLVESDVVVPAMRHLSTNSAPVTVRYATPYLDAGFEGANAASQVLLALATPTTISFGGGTDRSGGFVQPDLPVRGLSRSIGIVGDAGMVANPVPGGAFDPAAFLDGVLPKLFGLFELTDILRAVGLDAAPAFVTDQLDKIASMLADLDSLAGAVDRAVDRLADDAMAAATSALRDQAEAARSAVQAVQDDLHDGVEALLEAVETLMALDEPSDLAAVAAAVADVLDAIAVLVGQLGTTVRTTPMPTAVRAELERLVDALSPLLAVAEIASTLASIVDFVNGLDPSELAVKASFEWRPVLSNFPDVADEDDALFFVRSDGFVLSVQARASGKDGVGFDALAELSDFGLNLFPTEPLVKLRFDRLAFRASSGRKPEVDVVFDGMEWCGVLSFIETLQELIPFDGFSDPPYVDVSAEGVTAGFDLALPNIAVGIFSLENISLGADVRVPFLGDAVTVGFYFCTREKPFRLTVMCIGGGGFVGLRLSPKGLVLLEMSLEACASLSVNLGVASGSVSVAVGVYLRLEAERGSLTGYFRIRGEVDVLGLISASITLELSLTYEFDTGKMVGRASITIEVEIFFLSFSVEVSCERRLAGSNGDPTFAEILGVPEDGTPLVDVPAAWSDYCAAFAGA